MKRTYTVKRGSSEPIAIYFQLTVPFGCQYMMPSAPQPMTCDHYVILTTPDYLKCSQGIYALDMCGKRIHSHSWNKTQSIKVQHKNDLKFFTKRNFEIHLVTKVRTDGETFWDGVKIPVINVRIFKIYILMSSHLHLRI